MRDVERGNWRRETASALTRGGATQWRATRPSTRRRPPSASRTCISASRTPATVNGTAVVKWPMLRATRRGVRASSMARARGTGQNNMTGVCRSLLGTPTPALATAP